MNPDLKLVNGGGAQQPLPVLETLKMTAMFLRSNFGSIIKVSTAPSILILLALTLFGAFQVEQEPVSPLAMLPSSLVTGALMAVIMVAVGRMVLFGDAPATFTLPSFGRVELLTWAGSILSSLATVFAGFVPGLIVFVLTQSVALAIVIGIFPAIIVALSLSLIYPILLTTGKLDFARSFAMTKGLLPRIFALIFLASLITVVVASTLMSVFLGIATMFLAEEGMANFTLQSTAVFMVVTQVLMACVNIVVISFAFRWIDYYSPDPLLKGD